MVRDNDIVKVLRATQREQEFLTDSAFAEALGVDRQKLWNWLNYVNQPDVNWLKLATVLNMVTKPWKAQMAIDILTAMGIGDEIPCSCFDIQGDNEYCPRHQGDGVPV
jgi:hypothetical protein